MEIIITAPSLDPAQNVSGVSSVTKFIIDNNPACRYHHFEIGKKDAESGGLRRIARLVKSFRTWKKMLGEKPNAIIHYNFPLSTKSVFRDSFFIWEAYRQGKKMAIHIHGGVFLTATRIPYVQRKILERIFSLDTPFIVLSETEKKTVEERFRARHVEVLPNCIDLTDAKQFRRDEKTCQPLTIGYLGRIEPNKGMTELLYACQQLRKEGVPFKLEIAGKEEHGDEYLKAFDRELRGDFRYDGVVAGKEKADFYKRTDVFVMPTYFEGLPMSLLECMSYGIVPVVTPVGSIPEVVEDGRNGLLVEKKNAEAIVKAIRQLSENRTLLGTLGKKAQKTIFEQFSPEKYIANLNRIYQGL